MLDGGRGATAQQWLLGTGRVPAERWQHTAPPAALEPSDRPAAGPAGGGSPLRGFQPRRPSPGRSCGEKTDPDTLERLLDDNSVERHITH